MSNNFGSANSDMCCFEKKNPQIFSSYFSSRGIVQLFNAVKKQQKSTEEKLKEAGSSELKRERVMKSVSKGEFLDMLKGSTSNVTAELVDAPPVKKSKKQVRGKI